MAKQPWYKKEISLLPVSVVDVVTMAENLSVMLESGLTVPEALDVLVEQTTGSLAKVLQRVNSEVQSGQMLGDALEKERKTFSPIFISSVHVGESSGTLTENLKHLSEQMERDLEIRRNVQGAMLYPSVVLAATVVIGLALATFVLPQLAGVFTSLDVELPLSTQIVMWLADVFQNHGSVITPLIIAALVAFIFLMRRKFMQPILHRFIFIVPMIKGFVHDINRARFARTMGTMLQTGVPIQEALKIGGDVLPNYVYRKSVMDLYRKIESGESFADIISQYPKLYTKMIQRMVAVGERSGSLGETLLYLARFYERKVAVRAKSLSTIIEPMLLIIIGLAVGFFAVSIFTPIYSVTEGLSL